MITYLKNFKQVVGVALVALAFSSCDKVDQVDPLGDNGQTLVKIIGGGNLDANFVSQGLANLGNRKDSIFLGQGLVDGAVDFVPTPTTIKTPVDIRRDIANNAELQKTMTVVVKDDTAAVTKYNAITGSNFIKLPEAWYTVKSPVAKVGGQGGTYTIVFAPGEFAKRIDVIIPDATVLNPSLQYAIAFTIVSADAGGKISYSHTLMYRFGAKNDYDGVYEVTGTFVDLTNATFMGNYPFENELVTTGATSVDVKTEINGAIVPGYLFLTSPTTGSYYGNYGLTMTFDPATDAISELHNYYGDPSKAATAIGTPSQGTGAPDYIAGPPSFRRAILDPTGVNKYDRGSKTIRIKYWLTQTNISPGFPRSIMNETWTFVRPR